MTIVPIVAVIGAAGVGVASAMLTAAGGVVSAVLHGEPHQNAPAAQ
jgi:hypothetical protein